MYIVDDLTRQCLAAIPDISGRRAAREPAVPIDRRGKPGMIVSDNGTELNRDATLTWSEDNQIDGTSSRLANRCRTASVKVSTAGCETSFSTKLSFFGLADARAKIADWDGDYDSQRPHSSLGYLTPVADAADLTATCNRLCNPNQLRRSHVAHSVPNGVTYAETPIAIGLSFSGRSTVLRLSVMTLFHTVLTFEKTA